jgi:hypothetical protein
LEYIFQNIAEKLMGGALRDMSAAVCMERPNQYWSPDWQAETDEFLFGDWRPGRFAWELANVKALPEPVPVSGKRGLWNWEGQP